MLIRMGLAAGAAFAMLTAVPALAQDSAATGWYGSLGYNHQDLTGGRNGSIGAITGRVGTRLSDWVGLEVEGGTGIKNANGPLGRDVHLSHEIAGYGVGYLPLSPNMDLFARVGYGHQRYNTGFAKVSGGSINYGVGAQYRFTDKDAVRFDATRQDRTGHTIPSANVYGVSYVRKF